MTHSYRFFVNVVGLSLALSGQAVAQHVDDFNPGANDTVLAIGLEASGSMIVGGAFTTMGGGGTGFAGRARIARLGPLGGLNLAFNPGANGTVRAVAVLPSTGQILVAGEFTGLGGGTGTTVRNRIGLLNPDGTVDASFNPGANGPIHAIAIQDDGRILVGGDFTMIGGGGTGSTARNHLARLEPSGAVDMTFNPGANSTVRAITIGLLNQIYVGGDFTGVGGGTGGSPRQRIARLEPDGTFLTSFVSGANDSVYALTVQPDGALLVGGAFTTLDSSAGVTSRVSLARVDPTSGAVDATYNPGSNGAVYGFALNSSRQLIVAGSFSALGGGTGSTPRLFIGRLNVDGSVDAAFNPGANAPVHALAIERDGNVVIGGILTAAGGGGTGTTARSHIARIARPRPLTGRLNTPSTGPVSINWMTGAEGPILHAADYAWSVDGVTYTPLGTSTRPQTTHSLAHPGFASDPNFRIRVRGVARTGLGGASQSVYEIERPVELRDMIENGNFAAGTDKWLLYDEPTGSGMTWSISGETFQFNRSGSQAVIFQKTGLPVPAFSSVRVTAMLGNTDTVSKRISFVVHDSDFSDLSLCTFWIPPSAPLQLYQSLVSTTKDWEDATLSIYAASVGTGGMYLVDDVTMRVGPSEADDTSCIDFVAPTSGGAVTPNHLDNGLFDAGLTSWLTYGVIDALVESGQLRLTRLPGAPAGVIFQPTGDSVQPGHALSATFKMASLAGSRTRVTVLIHEADFSRLAACTFWLEPHAAMSSYSVSTNINEPWVNATLSIYPATVYPGRVIVVDDVSLAGVPLTPIYPRGTTCGVDGAAGVFIPVAPDGRPSEAPAGPTRQ